MSMAELKNLGIEVIGWSSTFSFLFSILVPNRVHLHTIGIFTAITTGIYAYSYGATAIWVKWLIAFFFHTYMTRRLSKKAPSSTQENAIYQT